MLIGSSYKAKILKIYSLDSCTNIKCIDKKGRSIDLTKIKDEELFEIKKKTEQEYQTYYEAIKK